jgi:hypothetical protein
MIVLDVDDPTIVSSSSSQVYRRWWITSTDSLGSFTRLSSQGASPAVSALTIPIF